MKGIQNLKISDELENAITATGIEQQIRSVFRNLYDQGFHPIAVEHVLANEVHNSGAELRLMEGSRQAKSLQLKKPDDFHVRKAAINPVITKLLRHKTNDEWINATCNTNVKININEVKDWDTDFIIGNVFDNLVIHILVTRNGSIAYYVVNHVDRTNTKDLTDFDGSTAIKSKLLFDDKFVPLFVDQKAGFIYPYKIISDTHAINVSAYLVKLESILSELAVEKSEQFY